MKFKEWEKYKLIDVCTKIGSGSTPRGGASVYKKNGVSLIRSQNIYNNSFVNKGLVFIDDHAAEKLKNVKIEEKDVLLNITGDSVARCTIVPKRVLPARVNQHVCILRANSKYIDSFYLKYYLVNNKIQEKMLSLAKSGGTRPALTKSMIENLEINLPPLETQEKIASILSALDDKIELNNEMNKTLEEMAQTLFKRWFIDFDFPNENGEPYRSSGGKMVDSELGEIPEGWRIGSLEDIVDNFDAKRKPLSKKERDSREKKYPYYGAAGIIDYVDNYLFNGEYILLGEDGTVITNEGTPILNFINEKFWVSNHAHVIKAKEKFNNDFIHYLLKNTNVSHIVTGAVQPKINQKNLNGLKILIPKIKEISEFGILVSNFTRMLRNNNSKIKSLIQIRDTLLPKLMSGEIEV